MIRQIRIILYLVSMLMESMSAQGSYTQRMWVLFKAKDAVNLQLVDPATIGISERALKRRSKTLPPDRLIDELDLPVSESAIEQVRQAGVKIHSVSRWFNAVSVEATSEQIRTLQALPVVAELEEVVHLKRSLPPASSEKPCSLLPKNSFASIWNYGPSMTQIAGMRVVELHNLGVSGTGVLIGILDDGFNNYRTHNALKNIQVVADSDFIHNISDVGRQPWESSNQGNHGAGILSIIGGFDEGNLIGVAYGASFILAKTEMDSSGGYDFNSEEDTFVAALEWMELLGVDITSSSLGYKEFWGSPTYTTSDMDGRTTKVAQGAAIASRKGVIVVTAMGNEGNGTSTLVSPADADSIISVGAAHSSGMLASFSSCGPTADGRIKPELLAQGVSVYQANGNSTSDYIYANGTSCSTPLVAGAAALVLSVYPELTNMQVREVLLSTATESIYGMSQNSGYPNNYYGYGFTNAYSAVRYYGRFNSSTIIFLQNFPNPFVFPSATSIAFEVTEESEVELAVYNILGQHIRTLFRGKVSTVGSSQWDGTNERGDYVASGVYFLRLEANSTLVTKKMLYLK